MVFHGRRIRFDDIKIATLGIGGEDLAAVLLFERSSLGINVEPLIVIILSEPLLFDHLCFSVGGGQL